MSQLLDSSCVYVLYDLSASLVGLTLAAHSGTLVDNASLIDSPPSLATSFFPPQKVPRFLDLGSASIK